ncbi:pyruvate formate lyase activating enzyme [[Emmonsia] crescens]|uniref:Pyruvate formate lyase activating enzyme n=1 Tax=[Emmonsia] crescens TaxID=73230 RepID=A0A0G2I5F7_9EURO|nr:pyruvate formate lyase activating enzyme [Emmonsia crescens UAMH 3008]
MKQIIALPATLALVYRAWSRKSLTAVGIVAAALTAVVHALHPCAAPFTFLVVFFLSGTYVTKIKHDVKSRLTVSSYGSVGGEGPRTHVQVLANSVVASILILLDVHRLHREDQPASSYCFPYGGGIFMVGIVANYAVVAADTFSSELGILSKSQPRLITSLTFRTVPPGTNGGVTLAGLLAGALGAFIIGVTSLILPFCPVNSEVGLTKSGFEGGEAWGWREKAFWIVAVTIWGTLGSVLDSILGGLLQASIVDKRTGKIVEGAGGRKVLVHPGESIITGLEEPSNREGSRIRVAEDIANILTTGPSLRKRRSSSLGGPPDFEHESRKIESGHDLLDNNQVNLLMAAIMSVSAMVVTWYVM